MADFSVNKKLKIKESVSKNEDGCGVVIFLRDIYNVVLNAYQSICTPAVIRRMGCRLALAVALKT